jgi:hypothetical protein
MIVPALKDRYVTRSPHFSERELYDGPPFAPEPKLVFGPVLELAEAVRKLWGHPLSVNAGVRTPAKQADLQRRGYRTARYSPHVWRCALDIDTATAGQTRALVETIRVASADTGIPVRLGWQGYLRSGMTFVHMDVAPLLAKQALEANQIPAWVFNSWSKRGIEW